MAPRGAVGLLVLLAVASWMWIVVMARDMYGPMTGASAWMMTTDWDVSHLLLLWAMWAVMMTGMMLPSASPLVLLYGVAARRSAQSTAGRQIYALAAGYLVVWTVFSLGATVLQRALAALLLVSPMMEATSSTSQCDSAARRRRVSVDTDEARVPADVPVAPWVPHEPMARVGGLARSVWAWSTALFVWAVAGR